jgi:DNA-binding HxlR family transcriptional regulator
MTALLTGGESDFAALKRQLELTDGNLGAHLRVLEEHGYVSIITEFVGRKPRTRCAITEDGRKAFSAYLDQLEQFIREMRPITRR